MSVMKKRISTSKKTDGQLKRTSKVVYRVNAGNNNSKELLVFHKVKANFCFNDWNLSMLT